MERLQHQTISLNFDLYWKPNTNKSFKLRPKFRKSSTVSKNQPILHFQTTKQMNMLHVCFWISRCRIQSLSINSPLNVEVYHWIDLSCFFEQNYTSSSGHLKHPIELTLLSYKRIFRELNFVIELLLCGSS